MNTGIFAIQTFTVNADLGEDRIRLDAVDAGGDYQAIWLTRRLTDRFLPHLGQHAEKQVKSGLPAGLALSMAQERLRVDRAEHPLDPVTPQAAQAPWLCQTIQLTPRDDGLLWTLTDDAACQAGTVLSEEAVRAVLDVFLTTYRKLEWSEQAFPEWVREAAPPSAPPARSIN